MTNKEIPVTESVDTRFQQIAIASWFAECRRFAESLDTLEKLWEGDALNDLDAAVKAFVAVREMHRICDEFDGHSSFPMAGLLEHIVIDLGIQKAVNGDFEGWDVLGITEDLGWEEVIWPRLGALGYADEDTPDYPGGWELNDLGRAIFFPDGNPTTQFKALTLFEDEPPI